METLSLWSFLDESKPEFGNVIYDANSVKNKRRLHTSLRIEDLHIWKQVYVGPTIERLINVGYLFSHLLGEKSSVSVWLLFSLFGGDLFVPLVHIQLIICY